MARRRDSSNNNNNLNLNEIAGGSLTNSCGIEQDSCVSGSFFPRGTNSVYFHLGLLSTAQTYPCLTNSSNNSVGNNTQLAITTLLSQHEQVQL